MMTTTQINRNLYILEDLLLKENTIKDILNEENKHKKQSLDFLTKIKDLIPNTVIPIKKEDAIEFQNEKFFKESKSNIIYVPINYLL